MDRPIATLSSARFSPTRSVRRGTDDALRRPLRYFEAGYGTEGRCEGPQRKASRKDFGRSGQRPESLRPARKMRKRPTTRSRSLSGRIRSRAEPRRPRTPYRPSHRENGHRDQGPVDRDELAASGPPATVEPETDGQSSRRSIRHESTRPPRASISRELPVRRSTDRKIATGAAARQAFGDRCQVPAREHLRSGSTLGRHRLTDCKRDSSASPSTRFEKVERTQPLYIRSRMSTRPRAWPFDLRDPLPGTLRPASRADRRTSWALRRERSLVTAPMGETEHARPESPRQTNGIDREGRGSRIADAEPTLAVVLAESAGSMPEGDAGAGDAT